MLVGAMGTVEREGEDEPAELVFARNIRKFRLERHWSQEYLAYRADIHPTALSRVERSTRVPSLTTVVKLARALGVGVGELLVP